MNLQVRGYKQVVEEISVPINDITNQLTRLLLKYIKPACVEKYDSWFLKDGYIIGVSEYRHGSDSRTELEKASPELVKQCDAIHLVNKLLKEIK